MIEDHPDVIKRRFTLEEIVCAQRNRFHELLVGNLLDLKRHKIIFKKDPNYTKQNQFGQKVSIRDLIGGYIQGIKNAQSYMDILDGISRADSFQKYREEAMVPLPPEEKKPEEQSMPITGKAPTPDDSASQEESEDQDEKEVPTA